MYVEIARSRDDAEALADRFEREHAGGAAVVDLVLEQKVRQRSAYGQSHYARPHYRVSGFTAAELAD
jgi:hypothetical protein